MAAEVLHGLTIALSGELGTRKEPKTHKECKGWIKFNGGTYASAVDPQVTHLVCSSRNWTDQTYKVREARRYLHVKIVKFNWLRDSLLQKCVKNEGPYLWHQSELELPVKKRLEKEIPRVSFPSLAHTERAAAVIYEDLELDGWMPYHDRSGFVYQIILNRPDLQANINERFIMMMWERVGHVPPQYTASVQYIMPGQRPVPAVLLTRMPADRADVKVAWRKFFKAKTGVDWEYRIWGHQQRYLQPGEDFEVVLSLKYADRTANPGLPLFGEMCVGNVLPLTDDEIDKGEYTNYFAYTLPNPENGEMQGDMPWYNEGIRRFGKPPAPGSIWKVGGKPSMETYTGETSDEDSGEDNNQIVGSDDSSGSDADSNDEAEGVKDESNSSEVHCRLQAVRDLYSG